VRCVACGTPLTGAACGGRSKLYRHYWCRTPGCRAVKLRAEKLEAEFLELLCRLQPEKEVLSQFPKIAAKVWATKHGDAAKQATKMRCKIDELKRLKSALLRKHLLEAISESEYRETKSEFDAEIVAIEQELRLIESSRATLESFIQFAELLLLDIARAWEIAGPEQRQRVQNLLFQDGLHYSMESGILNRSSSSLFNMLEGLHDGNILLASGAVSPKPLSAQIPVNRENYREILAQMAFNVAASPVFSDSFEIFSTNRTGNFRRLSGKAIPCSAHFGSCWQAGASLVPAKKPSCSSLPSTPLATRQHGLLHAPSVAAETDRGSAIVNNLRKVVVLSVRRFSAAACTRKVDCSSSHTGAIYRRICETGLSSFVWEGYPIY
jgi:hypothetical protein